MLKSTWYPSRGFPAPRVCGCLYLQGIGRLAASTGAHRQTHKEITQSSGRLIPAPATEENVKLSPLHSLDPA